MKNKHIHFFLIVTTFILSNYLKSQTCASVKLTTLTYQFTETQPELIKFKLSDNGQLAYEPGILLSFEGYASPATAIKFSQIVIYDKAQHLACKTSVFIKLRLAKAYKHSLYFAVGPGLNYRKSWADMEGYVDEPVYSTKSGWQYKLNWLSGEIEYNYFLNKRGDLSISINHVQAESIGLAIGYKYWINKSAGKKRGCVTCPSFH